MNVFDHEADAALAARVAAMDWNHAFGSLQLERALRLARAFGHTWGHTPLEHCRTAASISAYWDSEMEGLDSWQRGITAPWVVDGVLSHVTGTGRSAWAIGPDGGTSLEIHRPGGDAPILLAQLAPSGALTILVNRDTGPIDVTKISDYRLRHACVAGASKKQEVCRRHVEALNDMLWALGINSCAAIERLRAAAVEEQVPV